MPERPYIYYDFTLSLYPQCRHRIAATFATTAAA